MSNDIIYAVGARNGANKANDLSLKIMNVDIAKRYFSEMPISPRADIDKVINDLEHKGYATAECAFGLFKFYTKDYIDHAGNNWTVKGQDPTQDSVD